MKNASEVVLELGDVLRRGTSENDGHTGIVWKIEGDVVYFVQSINYDSDGDDNRDSTKGKWGLWAGTGNAKSESTKSKLLSGNFVGVCR